MVAFQFDVLKVLGGKLSIFDLVYFGRPRGWKLANNISQPPSVLDLFTHCVVV